MTIKKKRTKIILPSILTVSLTCGLLLTGCQKTPDQSAVVSKAGGLSEDVIAEPLKDGETQTLDLPEHWDTTVTWSNDRGVFHADQKLESVTTGNLPVIEVSQKKLELEQLKGLISYFEGGETLYQTQELTREYYQNLLDKIKNGEGFYADNSVEYDLTGLEKLVEEVLPLVPEQTPLQEIGQIEYTSKKTDPAYEAKRKSLEAYGYDILPDITKQDGMEIHFQATVGADAKGTINAETYDPEAGNYSIFSWSEGNGIRSFKWKGMSQEEKVVTENVKLLAFDEIESRLIDQVKYLYPSSQPAENKTIFGYDVATVELGYTYIPAYKNPQNAWLIPAWFFTISESEDTTAELGTAGKKTEGYQTDYIVLNATDGGRIGSYWR